MILSFTLITFAMFAVYVEQHRIRQSIQNLSTTISNQFGRADNVYPNTKQPQSWMRKSIIQSYK